MRDWSWSPGVWGARVGVGGGEGEPPRRFGGRGRLGGVSSVLGDMSTSMDWLRGVTVASTRIWMVVMLARGVVPVLRLFSGSATSGSSGRSSGGVSQVFMGGESGY